MFGVSDDQIPREKEPSLQEINAGIPRKVRLSAEGYQARLIILIVFGIGAIWCGGVSYFYFIYQAGHREALNREGREALGTITKIAPGRHTIWVKYTFHADALVYENAIDLEYEPLSADGELPYLHAGDPILVRYLPSSPWINHPSGWAWWSVEHDLIPGLFSLSFPGLGVFSVGYLLRDRRLARIGWVMEAEVIACASKGKQFRVDYVFSPEGQKEFDGARENCDEYATGSKIRIIYLRTNPKRNDTYPVSTYNAAGE